MLIYWIGRTSFQFDHPILHRIAVLLYDHNMGRVTKTQKPTIVAGFAIGSPPALFFLDVATKSSLRINASTFGEFQW